MRTLNSSVNRTSPMGIGVLAIIAFLLICAVPLRVNAAAVTVTVGTNLTAYSQGGNVSIIVTGTVVPAPITTANAVVSITNPTGVEVELASIPVSNATGIFSTTFVAGGGSNWANGTYTVTASYATTASGPVYTGSATFTYGTIPVTTTSTTSITNTTSTSKASVTTIINNYTTTKITTISSVTTILQAGSTVVTTITQPGTTVVTTIDQAGTTVVTTITQPGTTIVTTQQLPGATTTQQTTLSSITTVQQNATTALAIGAIAIIIAIIAGVFAVLAMRKK